MWKIILDTSKRFENSVSLVKNKEVVKTLTGDIDIAFSIQCLLEEHKLSAQDIESIEANSGPGSYTGLRVGLTVANVFNWAKGNIDASKAIFPHYGAEPKISERKPKTLN